MGDPFQYNDELVMKSSCRIRTSKVSVKLFVLIAVLCLGRFLSAADGNEQIEFFRAAANDSIGKVKLLLERGVQINSQAPQGHTALMLAAAEGKTNMVKLLLEQGADVNIQG